MQYLIIRGGEVMTRQPQDSNGDKIHVHDSF